MTHVLVTIKNTAGSAPRDAGTQMTVWADRIDGTIGGGALEWAAMQTARQMLRDGTSKVTQIQPLGPMLGQCCGGSVTLLFEHLAMPYPPPAQPLWIWGAGHVGRAIAGVFAPMPDWSVTLIDDHSDRLPASLPGNVAPLVATNMPDLAPHAPDTADHLILTYDHQVDLALCHTLLSRPFGSVGLIGSATKWARFRNRLQALGHTSEQISRIGCPIGDPGLGKHPQAIAVGVAAALLNGRARGARQDIGDTG